MGLICPKCRGISLKITSAIELPPDSRSDDIAVQILKCAKCGFAGLGVYEETRRGALGSESFYHRGYYLDDSTLSSLEKLISQCPKSKKHDCQCKIHRSFSCTNELGRWNWLDKIPHKEVFVLERA